MRTLYQGTGAIILQTLHCSCTLRMFIKAVVVLPLHTFIYRVYLTSTNRSWSILPDLPLFLFSYVVTVFVICVAHSRKRRLTLGVWDNEKGQINRETLETTSRTLYPSRLHGAKVKDLFLEKKKPDTPIAVLLCGSKNELNKYCDTVRKFRQERYFLYLSGVDIPGSAIIHDFSNDSIILFLPDVDKGDILWSGLPLSLKEAKNRYEFDEVYYISSMASIIKERFENYTLFTTDTDNLANEYVKDRVNVGDEDLFWALDNARLTKSWYEIKMLTQAAQISSDGHHLIMKRLLDIQSEVEVQAEFVYNAKRQGTREIAYEIICGSGPNGGILHYIKNTESLAGKASILVDAGVEWRGYASDITRSLPLSGAYTKEHREIYEAVLDMQSQTVKHMKSGTSWEELHLLSHRVLIKHLKKIGIFKECFNEDEIYKRKVTLAFYPHGLGHLMGLDVHDCGGCPDPKDENPYFKNLRLRRKLLEGMVVTNEPGCYFNQNILEEYLYKFPERMAVVDMSKFHEYAYIGGVRIEDDFLITKTGSEKLSSVTSDPDEIERIITKNK